MTQPMAPEGQLKDGGQLDREVVASVATEAPVAPSPPAAPAGRAAGLVLAVLLVAVFMAVLDATIVNVAAPAIRRTLHASGAELQLVITGYTIAYAVLIVTGSRLGAMFGHRRAFLGGLVGFTLASLGCALAPDTAALIGLRAVQGAGAALMMPQVLSLIQMTFSGASRAKAIGRYAAVIATGAIVGQVVGGAVVSADLFSTSWRPVFMLNVPIGALLLIAGLRLLPRDVPSGRRRLDLGGMTALAVAVLLFVVPVVMGHQEGWPAWTFVALAASLPALWLFARVERGVEARDGTPMVPRRVLSAKGFAVALTSLGLGMATYGGYLFSTLLHLQTALGDSPLRAGLLFSPAAVVFAAASLSSRRLAPNVQRLTASAGLLTAAVGYGALALDLRSGGNGGTSLEVFFGLVGLGLGAAFTPLLNTALAHVAPSDAPDASGVVATVQQLALVTGIALFGSIYLSLNPSAAGQGAHHPGPAIAWCMVVLMATAAIASGLSTSLWRLHAPVSAAQKIGAVR